MPDKYIVQRRTASGLENVAELPALKNGKVDLSWLPVVGSMGSAIIERGSNANGEYVRWADGTQVCYQIKTKENVACIYKATSLYRSEALSFTFPAIFIDIPVVYAGLTYSNDGKILCALGQIFVSGGWTRAYSETERTTDLDLHYLAIGRWK